MIWCSTASLNARPRGVTHESDRCYLICQGPWTFKFKPGEQLVVSHSGEVLIV